jgi:phage terminase large subunit-like protein
MDLHKLHPMEEVAYDPTFASQIAVNLQASGLPVFCFYQRATMMTPVLNELDRLTRAGLIHHGKNPLLTWAMSNLEVSTNADGFMKPIKGKGVHRIDPAVATLMALGPDLKAGKVEEPSHFELLVLG